VLVLDSLEDPHNVGSLLRSAEAAGVHGVIFPTHRQAPLSPSAIKASAGAVEHLLLCPVDDLAGALSDLHVRGVRIAGAEGDAPMTARESDLRGPLAIVVGSEGQGLGPAVRRRCDMFMRIPMRGAVGSLNAAVAGSILLFEAVAQRDMERADGSPPAPTEAPAKAKPKRATKATAAVAPPAPAEAPAKAPAAPKPKPKPKRATKATATVAQPAAAEAPAKAKPRRIAKTTASAAPAAPVKPKRAARPKPAANDVPTAPDDGESDLLPD
jgi:tRNA(Leu) C34 or U34 (ribose-2'-O)-methylase TrmL